MNGVGSSIETSVKSLNDTQVEAENAQVAFARGDDISVHEVMIAAEKSNLSMQMAIQLRNKVINAYNEINQIKV
ncbi:MAG: flagellar hook-basal body complex protein FliE [Candidatus Melainabacteria bacterium]|nr:MAG: flagellar hook-basal body complex protein FliE [Candidatus Melainabacteria bacterium]